MAATAPCPKCGRMLLASGELDVSDESSPVYQCDECTMMGDSLGEPIEVALTFCLDTDGRPIDPATGEPIR